MRRDRQSPIRSASRRVSGRGGVVGDPVDRRSPPNGRLIGIAWSYRPRAAVREARLLRPKAVAIPSMDLTAIEAKPFVPASDLERAKQFYSAIGFEIPWSSEDLAYVRHGQTAFLLQAFIGTLLLREAEKRCGGPKLFTSNSRHTGLFVSCLKSGQRHVPALISIARTAPMERQLAAPHLMRRPAPRRSVPCRSATTSPYG